MKLIFTILGILIQGLLMSQTCNINFENFNSATNANPPVGWIRGAGTDIAIPSNGGDKAVGFNTVGEYMVSKAYACAGQVCFKYKASGASSNWDLTVSYSQGDTSATAVWTPLLVIATNGSGSPTTYQQVCIDIPEANLLFPFNVRVRWQMTRRVSGTIYFDDVCADGGTCIVQPSKFSFQSIPNGCLLVNTPTSISVCATDQNGNVATSYTDDIALSVQQGSGTISGATSGQAVNGCFNANIAFSDADLYTLSASSPDNSFVGISNPINVANSCPLDDTVRVMAYNILNFPLGRNDCSNNTLIPHRWDTLAKICEYFKPDVLMVCELQNEWGSDSILAALNRTSNFIWQRAAFVPNQSTSFQGLNNMLFYNSEKLSFNGQDEVITTTRDINRYILFGNDPGLSSHFDTTFIDLYMSHLKAGPSGQDSIDRATDCQFVRDYVDAFPAQRNFILGGDLNLYTNQEGAYTVLLGGTYPFYDPLDLNVNWEDNPAYAYSHTQSSRSASSPNYDCGIVGGCDSRFDFLLASSSIINNSDSVKYIPSTYHTAGNNGSSYNESINDPSNTSGVPFDILNAMYYMSDHLPVLMDLRLSYQSLSGNCSEVMSANEQGPNSLREVVQCVTTNQIVNFSSLLNDSTIIVSDSAIYINKSIQIIADPSDSITISSIVPVNSDVPTVFVIAPNADVVIEGLTIDGGFGPMGNAILNYGYLILRNVVVRKGGASSVESVVYNQGTLEIQGNCKIE